MTHRNRSGRYRQTVDLSSIQPDRRPMAGTCSSMLSSDSSPPF